MGEEEWKNKRRKKWVGQRVKPSQPKQLMCVWGKKNRTEKRRNNERKKGRSPTQAIDALIEEEKQNRRMKERKKQRIGSQPNYQDHSVASYDLHGSFSHLL